MTCPVLDPSAPGCFPGSIEIEIFPRYFRPAVRDPQQRDPIDGVEARIIATEHPGCQRTRTLANRFPGAYDAFPGRPKALEDLDGSGGILPRESSGEYLQNPSRIPSPTRKEITIMRNQASHEKTSDLRERSDGFTLVELLVVIAIIGTLAAMFSGNILSALRKGDEVSCTNNLRNMGQASIAFALDRNFFPVAKGKNPPAYESLNVLLSSSEGSDLSPDVFVCPASTEERAEKDDRNKFVLDEMTNSYAWLGKKTKASTSASTALGADDSIGDKENGIDENHEQFLMVVYAGGDVQKVPVEEIREGKVLPGSLVDQSGD
jgi:prepilin-type N-terminal cleavage/methylation domain-containing protein